jgi:peroxiredoxin
VDPPDANKNLADKIASDGKGQISFSILSDPDHKIIDAYGLHDPAYKDQKIDGIPHPAVYIINKDGKVTWAKIESDYRKRPTNVELRAALNLR